MSIEKRLDKIEEILAVKQEPITITIDLGKPNGGIFERRVITYYPDGRHECKTEKFEE